MTRGEAWLNHASLLLVGGTGVVYGWMKYFVQPEDEFAIVNHPWQPDVQHLHVVLAPLSVLAVGMLWRKHVWARVRSGFKARRPTGLLLTAIVFPMIFSGYLLQVSVEESWRTAWIWVHVVTSVLWIGGYGVHQLSRRS